MKPSQKKEHRLTTEDNHLAGLCAELKSTMSASAYVHDLHGLLRPWVVVRGRGLLARRG